MAKKSSKKNKQSEKKQYVWKNKSIEDATATQAVLMWPNISAPYTYLNTLVQAPADHTQEHRIAAYANGILNMSLANNKYDAQKYKSSQAIQYLITMGNVQRTNEIAFIKAKINEMQNFDGKTAKKLSEQLQTLANDPASFKYSTFITIINEAISGVNTFLARINRLKNGPKGRDLERNLMGNVESLFYNYTERRRRYNLSVEELTRTLVMRFLQTDERLQSFISNQIQARIGGQEHAAAAIILLQRLFATYINEHHAEYLKLQKDYFSKDEFIDAYEKITKDLNSTIDTKQVDRILSDTALQDEIIKEYGITVDKKGKVGNSGRKKADQGTITGKEANTELKKMLTQLGLNDEKYTTQNQQLNNFFKNVNFNYKSEKKISFQEEIMTAVITSLNGHAHMGKLNMGTDYLGVYIPTFNEKEEQKANNIAQTFADSLKNRLEEEKAQNDPEKTKKIYTEELNKLKKILQSFKSSFILHETTKLYTSIEGKGSSFYNSAGFSGRSMNIMNYIDEMANFSDGLGLDTNWLKFLAYNVSGEALGSHNISTLESVLATAGAMIMFDDVSELAASVTTPQTNATSIHFYKLNGIYVPISYYLYATAKLTNILFEIDPGEAVTAVISPASITYSRPIPGIHAPTDESDWNEVKSQAENTNISLHFGAKFLTLVSNLLNS